MKVKELFKNIQATNKLQEELQSNSRASVQIYVDDIAHGHECHSLYEFKFYLESVFTEEFINACLDADFKKTYNNTLSATLEFKYQYSGDTFTQKVDLFVEMGIWMGFNPTPTEM